MSITKRSRRGGLDVTDYEGPYADNGCGPSHWSLPTLPDRGSDTDTVML